VPVKFEQSFIPGSQYVVLDLRMELE